MPRDDAGADDRAEDLETLVAVLDCIRTGSARTRPEMVRETGLGRTIVAQRVTELLELGLVREGDLAPSSGGRSPRQVAFRTDAGCVLVVQMGATSIDAGITDLGGSLVTSVTEPADLSLGPEVNLARVERLLGQLLARARKARSDVWGLGIGVPGPVEFATGRPIAPPIMPGWDGYPIRERLARRFDVPVWVDNDVNLMALGELRAGLARGDRDVIFLKIGTGIGAGLISAGRLHRGAQGCAGDVGHVSVVDDRVVCRCGNIGCLEALAGGAALARDGTEAARSGASPYLARQLTAAGSVTARDVAEAAAHGDRASVELLGNAGSRIGKTLSTLVSFYNPSLVVLGGGVADAGDAFLASIRETVYRRSLPLATRELKVVRSALGLRGGLLGAAFMAIEELFTVEALTAWLDDGTPFQRPDVQAARGQVAVDA